MDAAALIDLERYPIDKPDGQDCAALIAAARRDLATKAMALLPGFLQPKAVAAMAAEAMVLAPQAHPEDLMRTPYDWLDNAGFPAGHPRVALHRNRKASITRDRLDDDGAIVALFLWDPLTEFIRRALGFETLYRCADPYLALEVHIEEEADELAWHFDANDGVVSLLLQAPDSGGEFEYAPFVRDEADENYDEVARVFAGTSSLLSRPKIAPGTFTLFRGRRSAHRVTRVGPTTKPRLMAVFSYDRQPGMVFSEATQQSVIGRTRAFRGTARS
jgi:hypothetical protein